MCVEKCCSSARLYKQKAERMRRAYSLLFVVGRRLECPQKKKKNFGLYMDFLFFFHMYIDVPVQVFLDAGRVVG
jgi:hypothetical protein